MNERILLVEDNPADSELLEVAFEDVGREVSIEKVRDGRQAKARLQSAAEGDRQVDLIVLDLNIPVVSGLELLAMIKADGRLRQIATVMLTSSDRAQDRERALELGAASYLLKPHDLTGYEGVARELCRHLAARSDVPPTRS